MNEVEKRKVKVLDPSIQEQSYGDICMIDNILERVGNQITPAETHVLMRYRMICVTQLTNPPKEVEVEEIEGGEKNPLLTKHEKIVEGVKAVEGYV